MTSEDGLEWLGGGGAEAKEAGGCVHGRCFEALDSGRTGG